MFSLNLFSITKPDHGTSQSVVSASPAGLQLALPTFIDSARKNSGTYLTLVRSAESVTPADVSALVALTQVLCCISYCLLPNRSGWSSQELSLYELWRRTLDNHLCTIKQAGLVPLWTCTSPPPAATDVAELCSTTTETVVSRMSCNDSEHRLTM